MIGTLTFHWATNYGAVIQSYALQRYLLSQEFDTEIINYVPWKAIIIQYLSWMKKGQIENLSKELKIAEFRKRELILSKKYLSNKSLKRKLLKGIKYDSIVCGSDQIWNQSFTFTGELKPTFSYFIDFVPDSVKRIAYAASFGSTSVSKEYVDLVTSYIGKFNFISVRENTAVNIVKELGSNARVVCDPTLLLEKEEYLRLISRIEIDAPAIFPYILHDHKLTNDIYTYIIKIHKDNSRAKIKPGIKEWLYYINKSKLVVTNSFHGVMLSVILNRPFVAVLIEGSGMNDRINTILYLLGLENRIVRNNDRKLIDSIVETEINWDNVNNILEELRKDGQSFLKSGLMG